MTDKKELTLEERFAANTKTITRSYIGSVGCAAWTIFLSGGSIANFVNGNPPLGVLVLCAAVVPVLGGYMYHKGRTDITMQNMKIAAKLAATRPESSFFDLPSNDRK